MRLFPRLIALCAVLVLTAASAVADEAPPPSWVGRISLAEAGAGWRAAGRDWSDAAINLPVATGTSLRTAGKGRAELRLGSIAVALAPGSKLNIVRFDANTLDVSLSEGRIGLRLERRVPQAVITINTPHGSVRLAVPGQYDIGAGTAQAAGRITVFSGTARIAAGGGTATIPAGQQAAVSAGATMEAAAAPDAFAEWWRGNTAEMGPIDHIAPALTGAAALAANGSWKDSSDFGLVWVPKGLPDGWVPFRDGNWRFIPPWGWTWVAQTAWGFATSHYGRWVRTDDQWAWAPPADKTPAYAPAVVAFLGTPGIGLSYAGGSGPAIAWFPLGPGEPYWAPDAGEPPASVIDGSYRYRRFATAVPRAVFVAGKPTADALVDIPERRLAIAPLVAGGPQIPPARPHPPAVPHQAAPHPSTVAERVAHQPATPSRPAAKVHVVAKSHAAATSRPAAPKQTAARAHADAAHHTMARAERAHHAAASLASTHQTATARRHPAAPAVRHAARRGVKSPRTVHLAASHAHATGVASHHPHLAAAHHILRQ